MPEDKKKPYKQIRISVHEVIDGTQEPADDLEVAYSTNYIKHVRNKDGSVSVATRKEGELPIMFDFLSVLSNSMACTILDEIDDAEGAMRLATIYLSMMLNRVAEATGMSATVMTLDSMMENFSPEATGMEALLDPNSSLTDEQRAALDMYLRNPMKVSGDN